MVRRALAPFASSVCCVLLAVGCGDDAARRPAESAPAHRAADSGAAAGSGPLDPGTWQCAKAPVVEGLDHDALQALLDRAVATHSDAVALGVDGKLVVDETFGRRRGPIETMSVTKSIVSLAIGCMLADGHVASIDDRIADYFPDHAEWQHGPRAAVTLRHVLSHTSGLAAELTTERIYASDDFVAFALAADCSTEPGTQFCYNNRAVNLLAGVAARVCRRPLDEYVRERLLLPLGIQACYWQRDRAANPHAMSGLALTATELLQVGQLVADGGRGGPADEQIVPASWIEESTRRPQPVEPRYGLLWWLIPEWTRLRLDDGVLDAWRRAGVDARFLARLEPLRDRVLERYAFAAAMRAALGGDDPGAEIEAQLHARKLHEGRPVLGPTIGCYANGYLGQWLVVLPARRIVAVRQIRRGSHAGGDDGFGDFVDCVLRL